MFERERDKGQPDETSGTSAFLGKGSRVTGKLAFEGTVRIEGHVEGEISAQDTLIVGETAVVNAQINGASVVVHGRVTGDITARKRLERELLEISERERQRIGCDLHDGLGQQLHGLSYLAALLEKELKEDASPRAAEAGQLNSHLQEALDLTRGLAQGLQPVKSIPQGLMIGLRELAERTQALYRVDCRFECRAPVLIHRHSAATHLFCIAQEAVNNAMKHAKPTRVRIKLAATAQRIVLSVWDNGAGIRYRKRPARGMGLHIMQYRADALRGTLTVQKLPERGTEVVCTVQRQALLPEEENIK
jgi:two-component system CheB/CheR fusion protein